MVRRLAALHRRWHDADRVLGLAAAVTVARCGRADAGHEPVSVEAHGAEAPADWASLRSPENHTGYERTIAGAPPRIVERESGNDLLSQPGTTAPLLERKPDGGSGLHGGMSS